jgi:AcrR family transcriptional regulator
MPAEARKAQIIAAARAAFLQRGFAGTRVREIAAQAGITENLVYLRFASKSEIYEAAVTEPLDRLVDQLVEESGRLGRDVVLSRDDRQRMFEAFHRVLLVNMVEIAPLLAVALFSEPGAGQRYYRDVVLPRFGEAVTAVISEVTGWPLEALQVDVLVEGLLGLHFGLALDASLSQRPLDVDETARQLAAMFGTGLVAPGIGDPGIGAPGIGDTGIGDTAEPDAAAPRRQPRPSAGPPGGGNSAPDGVAGRTRMTGAQRRAHIARAARQVFVEKGLAGARTKEIAARAGVSEAFMLRVYSGKDELYRESIEVRAAELVRRLERDVLHAVIHADGGVTTLRAVIECGLNILPKLAPTLLVALFSEAEHGREFYRTAVDPVMRQVGDYLASVRGWDLAAIDVDLLWRALLSVQLGIVLHDLLTGQASDPERISRQLTRLAAAGLR